MEITPFLEEKKIKEAQHKNTPTNSFHNFRTLTCLLDILKFETTLFSDLTEDKEHMHKVILYVVLALVCLEQIDRNNQ